MEYVGKCNYDLACQLWTNLSTPWCTAKKRSEVFYFVAAMARAFAILGNRQSDQEQFSCWKLGGKLPYLRRNISHLGKQEKEQGRV